MKRQHILLPAIVISLLLLQLTFAALPRYEITDLGTLGGDLSEAKSINDSGQIVGWAEDGSGRRRATLFDASGLGNNVDLGTLGGNWSHAFSINNSGQIVGAARNTAEEWRATLFDESGTGNNINLGMLPGFRYSSALSTNNNGQIVGWVYDSGSSRATLFDPTGNGNNIDLGTLGGDESAAISINDSGRIVGSAGRRWQATLFDASGSGNNINLGTLPGFPSSYALSINNGGQIVGWVVDDDERFRATLFDPTGNGNNVKLGTLGGDNSEALSINNNGKIVGSADLFDPTGDDDNVDLSTLGGDNSEEHSINNNGKIVGSAETTIYYRRATLFGLTSRGNCIDLNTLIDPNCAWTLTVAYSINDNDWIVGGGYNPAGEYHAYLLIPKPPRTYYVDDDANGLNDGSSWADAFNYLQDTLAAAYNGDEIRVAQGTYKPDQGAGITPGDREATFQLKNGVILKGGYAGYGEPNPNACDVDLYETILTGDLNGDDGPNFADNADNSYHVVTGTGTDETAVLDAFTITGGNANGPWQDGQNCGGGAHNYYGNPTLTNCTFNRNWADGSGGGMYNYDGRPTLINCTFSNNSAGNKGGGVYSHDTYEMTLINCRFSGNSAGEDGGGMACWYNYNNSPTLTNCIFSGNSAGNKGGGMSFVESEPVLSNCSFSGNSAGNKGGGIYMNFWYGYPVLTNCVLWGNSDFAGMGESAQINTDSYGPPVINYICVQGWTGDLGGLGNHGEDPLFVDADGDDNIAGTEDDNLRLLPDSPCIGAGDPNYVAEPNETDLDGRPRVIGDRIDMGAYEFQRGPRDLYVDADAAGANNGSSWADAFNYLQDALTAASRGDEIWVAQGIYKPDQGTGITPGDREATFQLINGVTLKGGYAGASSGDAASTDFGQPDPNARNIELYETILTGDLNGDDIEIAGHINLLDEPTRSENSYRVVTANGNDRLTALDGFIITAGNANGIHSMHYGGGMNINNAYVQVTHCTFTTNSARLGGGIFTSRGSPTIRNNTIRGNLAEAGGAIKCSGAPNITHNIIADNNAIDGAGIWVYEEGIIANNIITKNTATRSGGGIFLIEDSTPMIINNVISENWAEQKGGGIGTEGNDLFTLIGNLIVGNGTAGKGGGIHLDVGGVKLTNNTIFGNKAETGGGMYGGGTLTNCIIWANTPDQVVNCSQPTYSCIQDWPIGGVGNIDADPCFVELGYWDANGIWIDGDYHLLPDSPCIDAGDPNYVAEPNETDLDGRPRIISGRIDMGAYEYSPPIPAEVKIVPRTINLTSRGNWITCYIWLPEEYNVTDIDPNSVLLEGEIKPEEFSVDQQKQVAVLRFSREDVQPILEVGDIDLTIIGRLTDGTVFEGTDTIRVLDKGVKK